MEVRGIYQVLKEFYIQQNYQNKGEKKTFTAKQKQKKFVANWLCSWLNCVPQNDTFKSYLPIPPPVNVTLFRNKVSADIIKMRVFGS